MGLLLGASALVVWQARTSTGQVVASRWLLLALVLAGAAVVAALATRVARGALARGGGHDWGAKVPEEVPEEVPAEAPQGTTQGTPQATSQATSRATPQATPPATLQATPLSTPLSTPNSTPRATPQATPRATLQATPQATPRRTPQAMVRRCSAGMVEVAEPVATFSRSCTERVVNTGCQGSKLESQLAACEDDLEALAGCRSELEVIVPSRRAECEALYHRFKALAADALECSCRRDTSGAMEVFQVANAAMERMSGLLARSAQADEGDAPSGCNALEWRWVREATLRHGAEHAALRELCEQVRECCEHPGNISSGGALSSQPAVLLRFLRAQTGCVPAAARMFRDSLDWRWDRGVDARCAGSGEWGRPQKSTWRALLVEHFKVHRIVGMDRWGLPVYLFRWTAFDIAGAQRELGEEVLLDVMVSIHEEIVAAARVAMLKREAAVPGVLFIWDVGNYGRLGVPNWWSRMWALVRFLPGVARLLEANYPEVVRRIMVVRCGPATMALYRSLSSVLPFHMLDKCSFYGWRAAEWRDDLEVELPGSDLPPFLLGEEERALASAEPFGGLVPVGAAQAAQAAAAQDMSSLA